MALLHGLVFGERMIGILLSPRANLRIFPNIQQAGIKLISYVVVRGAVAKVRVRFPLAMLP